MGRLSELYSERTPYGEMSIAEVQANFIASLMKRSFITPVSQAVAIWINILCAIAIGLYLVYYLERSPDRAATLRAVMVLLGSIGIYGGLCLLLLTQGIAIPLTTPICGWEIASGLAVAYLFLQQSAQQRQKLAERQAVLFQARKLLYRVASDIHDGPLQDLKLVMDRLELLELQAPNVKTDILMERLETIGLALRHQLTNTVTLAEKLAIAPELQSGLIKGIQQSIERLIASGELTLSVKQSLQFLPEPKWDGEWIDAREDIFRFFREAIVNVIRHAQPPNGTATQVRIVLSQTGDLCQLVVENDGAIVESTIDRQRKSGGYGTKLMATIAAELPQGSWERVALATGGIRVTLNWSIGQAHHPAAIVR